MATAVRLAHLVLTPSLVQMLMGSHAISLIACHWQAARHIALMCNMLFYGIGSQAVTSTGDQSCLQWRGKHHAQMTCFLGDAMLQANQLQRHDSP